MAIIVPAVAGKIIHIGRAGENLATTVTFDVNEWITEFGNTGSFTLFVQQGGGEYYPQVLKESLASHLQNGIVEWEVDIANTTTIGMGKCELVYAIPTNITKKTVEGYYYQSEFYSDQSHQNKIEPNTLFLYIDVSNNKYYYYDGIEYVETTQGGTGTTQSQIVKSIIYDIVVTNSLDIEAAGDVPTPIESWLNSVSGMTDKIEHAEEYAQSAENSATLAAAWAGTPSGTDTPSATNNAYYWSTQSSNFTDEAEQWAKGTINGTPVSSTHAGYHDNSKYYSQQAAQWTTGGTSGTPSSTNNAKYYAERIQSLTAGTVTTGEPGTSAAAQVNLDTSNNRLTLDLTIPKGSGMEIDGQVAQSSNLSSLSPQPAIGSIYAVGSNPAHYWFKKSTGTTLGTNWIDLGAQGGVSVQFYDWN